MAKQNVSFAERHLEKVVIGVAGAILAAVTFLYVVKDPYSTEVSGDVLSPSAFYGRLDEKVGEVVNRFKNPQPVNPPEWKAPPAVAKTSTNLPVVFVPPNPAVPKPETGIELGGKLELVKILPPGKPALTASRGLCAVPPSQVKVIGEKQAPPSNPDKGELKDHYWTAIFATVPRRAQQEAFIRAQYALDRQHLLVTKVEVERQRLLPSGEWEEPAQMVMPYASVVLSCPPTVPLLTENGEKSIDQADHDLILALNTEAYASQSTILRPDFQSLLDTDAKAEWKVPAELPGGVKFDWEADYKIITSSGVQIVDTPTLKTKTGTETPRINPVKVMTEIKALAEKGKLAEAAGNVVAAKTQYDEAVRKIEEVASNPALNEKNKAELQTMRGELETRLRVVEAGQIKAKETRAAAEAAALGPDVDLCWATDTSVKPGEAYRYRVRLKAVNPHAGLLRKLKNPEDAAKVILAGDWSEWSDAMQVPPSDHLFFTGIDGASQSIKTELYHWTNGEWKVGRQSLAVGQPVSWTQSLAEFKYDGIIVSLDQARSYEDRAVNKTRKSISYKEARPTVAVTLVNAAGDVEEHLVLADTSKKRDLSAELLSKKPKDGMDRPTREGEGQPPARRGTRPRVPGNE